MFGDHQVRSALAFSIDFQVSGAAVVHRRVHGKILSATEISRVNRLDGCARRIEACTFDFFYARIP